MIESFLEITEYNRIINCILHVCVYINSYLHIYLYIYIVCVYTHICFTYTCIVYDGFTQSVMHLIEISTKVSKSSFFECFCIELTLQTAQNFCKMRLATKKPGGSFKIRT